MIPSQVRPRKKEKH